MILARTPSIPAWLLIGRGTSRKVGNLANKRLRRGKSVREMTKAKLIVEYIYML